MSQILGIIFGVGTSIFLFVGVAVLAFSLFAGALTLPRLLIASVLIVTAIFPSSPSNALGMEAGFNAYGKGGGYLFFSLYELTLIFLIFTIPVLAIFSKSDSSEIKTGYKSNPYWYLFALLFYIFLAYLFISFASPNSLWIANLGRGGVINIFFQAAIVSALIFHFPKPDQSRLLFLRIGSVAIAVLIWGLLRYLFLGGDPGGSYEKEGGSILKITFWDINFSIIAAMIAGWAIWSVAIRIEWSRNRRNATLLLAILMITIIALSARRTAQLGIFLSVILLWLVLPRGKRWLSVLILACAVPLVAYKLNARIGDGRSIVEKLIKGDQKQRFLVDVRYERNYELRLAWDEVKKSPWFGVGPAGGFNPMNAIGIEFHKGNYGFIHSGFGHVLMKLGFVGLALFIGIFLVYIKSCLKAWTEITEVEKSWVVASMSGIACAIPNLLVGTPIIEIRSMIVIGFCLAIPVMLTKPQQSGAISALSLSGARSGLTQVAR